MLVVAVLGLLQVNYKQEHLLKLVSFFFFNKRKTKVGESSPICTDSVIRIADPSDKMT